MKRRELLFYASLKRDTGKHASWKDMKCRDDSGFGTEFQPFQNSILPWGSGLGSMLRVAMGVGV